VRLEEVSGEQAAETAAAYYSRETFPRAYMDVPENPTAADFAAKPGQFPVFEVTDRP
jgi:hypothetical protein